MFRAATQACAIAALLLAGSLSAYAQTEDAAVAEVPVEESMIAPMEAPAPAGPSEDAQSVWWGNRSVSHDNHIPFEKINMDQGICERCDENMICCDTGVKCPDCKYVCEDCDNCPPMYFDKIFFDLDKSVLRPDGIAECQRVLEYLNAYPDKDILIEGHTCDLATDPYNVGLGQRRADSVKAWLIANGVSPSRIETRTYGETHPWKGLEERELNRRAVVLIVN
jgi:outer membrane protein OmpA-like peptidoglycan-associated protein